MTIHLQIDRLDWVGWNKEHATKHGVSFDDITAAIRDTIFIRPGYKDRFLIFGRNSSGRVLAVGAGEVPEKPNVYQVFSARPANRRERPALLQERET